MKRILSLLLCLLFLLTLPFPVWADDNDTDAIVDRAELLTEDEENILRDMAADIYDAHGLWISIITVHTLDGKTAEQYADDYYDNHYYQQYPDGVLLLIEINSRQWAISTCGSAINLLTDYELDQVFFNMADELGDDQFYDAFLAYLERLPQYMQVAPRTEPGIGDLIRIFPIALLIGAAAGGITILIMRSQMNTAKPQRNAGSYLINGSYRLKKHYDIFLYSRVTRTRKPDNHGGSSHRSSGGVRHGGRSGRF